MQIEINDKDVDILVELLYFGNYIVNGVRLHKDQVKKYRRVLDVVLKQYIEKVPIEKRGDAETLDDLYDCLSGAVDEYRDYYEDKIVIPYLAEKLADINYPIKGKGELNIRFGIHGGAEHYYEKMLNKKGFGILKVDDPEFEARMARSKEYWQIAYGEKHESEEARESKLKAYANETRRMFGDEPIKDEE